MNKLNETKTLSGARSGLLRMRNWPAREDALRHADSLATLPSCPRLGLVFAIAAATCVAQNYSYEFRTERVYDSARVIAPASFTREVQDNNNAKIFENCGKTLAAIK